MRSRDQDHPGQHGETPSLLKIQKLAGYGGVSLWSQLLGRLKQENCLNPEDGGCGELRSCHCTPVWVTTAKLRLKKKKVSQVKQQEQRRNVLYIKIQTNKCGRNFRNYCLPTAKGIIYSSKNNHWMLLKLLGERLWGENWYSLSFMY